MRESRIFPRVAVLSCNLQPLDLGIIRAGKAYYRRTLVQRVLINLEDSNSCDMIASAWSEVRESTTEKCWRNSGLLSRCSQPTEDRMKVSPEIAPFWNSTVRRLRLPEIVSFGDYVTSDDEVIVCEDFSESWIIREASKTVGDSDQDDGESSEEDEIHMKAPSTRET